MTCRLACCDLFCMRCIHMDMSSIATLVGSVGFPIVACCGMAWFIATTFRDFNNLMTKNNVLTEELIALLKNDKEGDNVDETNMA
nr:MAG TPA: YvrJ protein family protein [Bacteriophage sp.]